MTVINILTESTLTKSVDENQANLINLYLVNDPNNAKYPTVAYPTPGATLFSSGTTILRALFTHQGISYGVDGSNFFSFDSSGNRTTIGTLNTSSGWAKIKGLNHQLLIADSGNGYYYDLPSTTFGVIATQTSGNIVTYVSMTGGGSNYSLSTTASISDSTGTGAVVTPIISGGVIVGVTVNNGGSQYTAPTISFSDVDGSGATAVVNIQTNAFPLTIQDIECQDEFGLVLYGSSQTWGASSISNLTSWPGLSFASTSGSFNYNIAIVSLYRELYLLGTTTGEVWDNLGLANFTFGRNQSTYLEVGCLARSSVAKTSNTFLFLGQSDTGGRAIFMMDGYTPLPVSNNHPGLDYQLSTYTTVSDAIGFTYRQEKQEFYVITFPTQGVTWVYDIELDKWHERQSLVSGSQVNWIASCYTSNYGKSLIGDLNSGNIYYLDMTSNLENGNPITRTLQSAPYYQSGAWIYVNKLQIDFDNSPGENLSNWNLYISRDGGYTYGSAKPAVVQQDANGMYRVYWLRLGQAHAYTFKLTTSANMQTIILGAWII